MPQGTVLEKDARIDLFAIQIFGIDTGAIPRSVFAMFGTPRGYGWAFVRPMLKLDFAIGYQIDKNDK
jgi:hypothetical protein